jgi:N-acetylglucosamine kinase-like BadF-type ATPase
LDAALTVDEDSAAAWAGAFANPEGQIEPGAICIAGTGANCFGVNAAGERAKADGLGPLLGDRGSGYWIGETTLRAICGANDGAYPETALLRPVLDYYGVATVDQLIPIVYAPDFSRARLAGVLPILIQHASEDAVAARILREAGEQLAITTAAVLKRLGLNAVAITGGVLQNAALVRESYEAVLSERVPGVKVIEPRYDAVIGAALLGKK